MNEMIRVLRVRPGDEEPMLIEIQNRLEEFQNMVGGHIEAVKPFKDSVYLIVNEEGKLWRLPITRLLTSSEDITDILDALVGCVLIVGEDGEDFGSLTDEQIEKYTKVFSSFYIKADGWT